MTPFRSLLTNPTVFKIKQSPFLISTSSPSDADHLVHIIHTLEELFEVRMYSEDYVLF